MTTMVQAIENPSLERNWTSAIENPSLERNWTSAIENPSLERNWTSAIENPSLERNWTSLLDMREADQMKLSRALKTREEGNKLYFSSSKMFFLSVLKMRPVLKKREGELKKREEELEKRKIELEKREGDLKGDMDGKTHKGMAEVFEMPEADSGSLGSRRTAGDATEINESRDDDVVLDPFLCSGSLTDIRELIESGKLPSQKILDEMCKVYERKSQEIAITCKAIVEHIKSKHAGIVHVWAAYTIQNPHKIIFVVIVKDKSENDDRTEPLSLDKLITYSFVNQYVGEFSSEGSEVIKKHTSASEGFDEESYQKLQSCISKHSEDLMKKHKYLSIISACSNRSKGFDESWELVPEKCIVLYVQKKSYIPIDEEPFKTNYDDIPVDVREGAFIPYGHTAGEKLDPVRMGCQIGGDSFSGTLGCFIDHPQYGVCGLTCAHVLLHSLKLKRLKSLGMVKWPLHGMSTNVYQPADNQSVLGNVVQLICKKGTGNTCGMDVALFRITDRQPKTANFPDATAISGSSFQTINYDSWRMCDTGMLNLTQDRVVKFGSTTELRDGKIIFDAMGVKELESCPLFSGCATITLFNQIEVKDHTHGLPFADRGDSGALVFVVDDNNSQHTCIGIVEGGTTYGTVVVTPIVPILEELNVPCLKSFETEINLSHIHDNINNLKAHINIVESGVQGMHGDIQGLHGDIQGMQGEMQTVRQDIQNVNSNVQAIGSAFQGVQTLSSDIQIIKQHLLNPRP
ncbi:uncharacterized protein LOC132720096 [Ruditapes philippinarum]|uniref:uncharacterized protein LOC132720096 n=1 Tax=Ruditapes philippinarum TaxID=129788 RepID=UPI00295B5E81|nr:uncharacterized protein LOC132720096 [Ruditapes philippinarum]